MLRIRWHCLIARSHRGNKSVTPFRDCFNKPGLVCGIAQRLPQPSDRAIQSVVEVDKSVSGPKSLSQLVTRDHLSRALHQKRQNTKRLFLNLDSPAFFAQFTCLKVDFEDIKADNSGGLRVWHLTHLCLGRRFITEVSEPFATYPTMREIHAMLRQLIALSRDSVVRISCASVPLCKTSIASKQLPVSKDDRTEAPPIDVQGERFQN